MPRFLGDIRHLTISNRKAAQIRRYLSFPGISVTFNLGLRSIKRSFDSEVLEPEFIWYPRRLYLFFKL